MTSTCPGIAILGAKGFLGKALVRDLISRTNQKIITTSHNYINHSKSEPIWLDIRSEESVTQALKILGGFEVRALVNLICLGVNPQERNNNEDLRHTEEFALKLVQHINRKIDTVEIVINISTENIDNVDDNYSRASSIMRETLNSQLKITNLHDVSLPRLFGRGEPRGRFIADAVAGVRENIPIEIREPDRVRRLLHIDQVSAALANLVTNHESSQIDVIKLSNAALLDLLVSFRNHNVKLGSSFAIEIDTANPVNIGKSPFTNHVKQDLELFLHQLEELLGE